jgi:hypothetical protein
MSGVDCLVKDGVFYSKSHPNRAVKECVLGFAMYEREEDGAEGRHVGVTDQKGAAEFLEGEPLSEIWHYRVFS